MILDCFRQLAPGTIRPREFELVDPGTAGRRDIVWADPRC